jgi:surface protein
MKTRKVYLILLLSLTFSCEDDEPPPLTGFKLSLSSSPEEVGRINYSPWHSLYPTGQLVTLIPEPNDYQAWVFQKWEGDASGNANPLTLKMDSDKNVVAVFVKKDYPLVHNIYGKGTVLERVVENPSGREYPHGQTVELTAVPDEGWVFETWGYVDVYGVTQVSIENPFRIKIEHETEVRVRFRQKLSGEPRFFLAENGITCKCENVYVGQKGLINGVEYVAVNDDVLRHLVRQEDIDLTKLCTSLVTDMSYLFMGVSIDQAIGNWDVSNVTTMEGMFAAYQDAWGWDGPSENVILFNQPIGAWDVRNVTNMDYFVKDNFEFNQDLSKWCVIKIPAPPKETFPSTWTLPKPIWGTCPD